MKKISLFLVITLCLVFMTSGLVLAQEPVEIPTEPQVAAAEPELQWVWGEAMNLDPQNKLILVKYLDYETDQEKEITISVDEKTTFENIKDILEIKPADMLSIDYIVTAGGKNLAKNISLDKSENPVEITTPAAPAATPTQTAPGQGEPVPTNTTSAITPGQ